jgi:hypothetical protein
MTIRSGGRARERSQAHPAEPGTHEDEWQPGPGSGGPSGPGGGRGGNGRRTATGNANGLNG